MNVLSLFDGMSCGRQALERAGIKVDNYYACEIDKYAIQVTMKNYPDTIQLGDVRNIKAEDLPKIDIMMGGSPCQSFSFAGKRAGMSTKCNQEILTLDEYLKLKQENFEFEGQSYLFWEYMRVLKQVNPTYFLLENVKMSKKWEEVLSNAIGVKPILINSSLVSAQNRKRLYWTNISDKIEQPSDKGIYLKDILEEEVDEKYYLSSSVVERFKEKLVSTSIDEKDVVTLNLQRRNPDRPSLLNGGKSGSGPLVKNDGKSYCLDTFNSQAIDIVGGDFRTDEGFRWREGGKTGTLAARARNDESCGQLAKIGHVIRKLTPVECERLQTVKDNYTEGVSNTQRYKMIGNGWTVDVTVHILSYINKSN